MGTVSPRPILLKSPASSPGGEQPLDQSASKPQDVAPRPIKRLSVSKNYTIPPRPKPGRKPNNEVPPSRRKAQNREAQRAFRERKSLAVRQLEEQLAKQQQAFERQQEQMKEQIIMLQRQNMQLQYSPQSPQSPRSPRSPASPQTLQPLLAAASTLGNTDSNSSPSSRRLSTTSSAAGMSVGENNSGSALPASNSSSNTPSPRGGTGSTAAIAFAGNTPMSSPGASPGLTFSNYSYGLSPRSPGSPFGTPVTPADFVSLELLDQVLDQKLPTPNGSSQAGRHRRSSSSLSISTLAPQLAPKVTLGNSLGSSSGSNSRNNSTTSVNKGSSVSTTPRSRRPSSVRERTDPPMTNSPLDLINTTWSQPAVPLRRNSRPLEVDFTSAFTPREPRPLLIRSPPALKDRCGFCTDNSPCICAATAAREEGVSAEIASDLGTLGSPGQSFTLPIPAPAEGASPSTFAAVSITAAESPRNNDGGCTGNPDNCSQCRQDPMLTLFCSAISSKPASTTLSPYSTYIPAQAAYKTLSRHPRFGYADLGMIVDVLQVRSTQVEVNSVAKVLRILDTR